MGSFATASRILLLDFLLCLRRISQTLASLEARHSPVFALCYLLSSGRHSSCRQRKSLLAIPPAISGYSSSVGIAAAQKLVTHFEGIPRNRRLLKDGAWGVKHIRRQANAS